LKRGHDFEYRSRGGRKGSSWLLPDISWARFDWIVFGLAAFLLGMGLMFVKACFDANLDYGRMDLSTGSPFRSHMKIVVISTPVFLAGLYMRPVWLRKQSYLIYGVGIFLLLLVPVIGIELNNAKRWLSTPIGFNLQPSELMKIALVLALAKALYRNRLQTLKSWILPSLIALVPMAMIMKQPDLGTSLTIVPVTLGMFYLAGARARIIIGLCLAAGALGFFSWQAGLVKDYQLRRIDTWARAFDPDVLIGERNAAAFHTYHARTAIGNGGMDGSGLGQGIANTAGHLPAKESDSIWSVVAEELGLVNSSAVLLAYALFAMLLLRGAGELRDRFSRLVVGGVGLYFGAHFFIHIGVNTGLLPMTGLTLPLFSTGGSSMIASFGALGVALGLSARRVAALDADAFR
jgi:rod shape determining protein RodA